jgi:chemosensory pili system protein ChpA (sensor histidine kinase/response regulator)
LLEAHPFLSASTISGAGAVIFVLHVGRLFELAGVAAERWLETTTPEAEGVEAEEPTPTRGVLVVDDSISVRKLAVRFIESEGLDVETAVDGVDALEKLHESKYRVVVTDLEMPRMHGYDLIEAMKNNPELAKIPIIVCTSRASQKHRRRAQDLGAEGYLTKPFSKEEIVAEIMRVSDWYEDAAGATGTT